VETIVCILAIGFFITYFKIRLTAAEVGTPAGKQNFAQAELGLCCASDGGTVQRISSVC
jgi:hypothetical protein